MLRNPEVALPLIRQAAELHAEQCAAARKPDHRAPAQAAAPELSTAELAFAAQLAMCTSTWLERCELLIEQRTGRPLCKANFVRVHDGCVAEVLA